MKKQDLQNKLSEMKLKWKIHPVKGSKEYYEYRSDIAKYNLMVKEFEKIESGELTCEQMEKILK